MLWSAACWGESVACQTLRMTHAAQGGGGHLVLTGPKQDLAPLMVAAKGQDLLLMGPL